MNVMKRAARRLRASAAGATRRPETQRLLALLPLAAAMAWACGERSKGSEASPGASAAELVIGIAWPWEAQKGVLYAQGLELAAEEVNAGGGVKSRHVRLLRADDHESVDEGRQVAQRLARDPSVLAVIGHLQSYVTVPAAAIYDLEGMVMVAATSTTDELTARGYSRVFRTIFTDRDVGTQMVRVAVARGFRRVAIYYIRTEYGRGLANAFEEEASNLGVRIVDRQSYDPGDADNRTSAAQTASAWKEIPFDAAFIAGEAPQAARLIVELRRQGVTVPILGGDAMGTSALVQTGGTAVEGTVVAAPFHPSSPREEARAFTARFQARFGTLPDAGAALGYDAVHVLVDAMRRAPTLTRDGIAQALHATHDWPGATGALTFNERGELQASPFITLIVRDGKFEYSGPLPVVSEHRR